MNLRPVKIIRNICLISGLAGFVLPCTSNSPALLFLCVGFALNVWVSIRKGPRRSVLGLGSFPFMQPVDETPLLFMWAVSAQTLLVVILFLGFLSSLL
jgi:hypothetical protein